MYTPLLTLLILGIFGKYLVMKEVYYISNTDNYTISSAIAPKFHSVILKLIRNSEIDASDRPVTLLDTLDSAFARYLRKFMQKVRSLDLVV